MKPDELKLLIAEGEGLTVEFKEQFTPKIDRDLVALANARGGFVFLGVNDEGEVTGEKLTNRMKAEILSLARNCEPAVTIPKISQTGKVVVIDVSEGDDKPHSCSSGYFRRLDAVTQKMTHKEVGLLFKSANVISFEERFCRDVAWGNISKEKIRGFFKEAGINAGKMNPQDILTSLNLATKDGIKNAGVLFFAREPRRHILQCETILVSYKGTKGVDILDRKDIQDDLWTQYQEAMIFLKRHLSVRTEIKGLDRKDYYEIPLEALREAVANAIIHRDYSMRGTSIMVEVHEDRVMIKNPGGFPAGMSQEKLGDLSIRRNELIADIFARMHRVERMGSGFKRIRESMEKAELPFPKVASDSFFFIEFERPKKVMGKAGGKEKSREKGKEKSREKILDLISNNAQITAREIANAIELSIAGVEKTIRILKKEKRLKRVGPDKGGHWEVVK